jgi:hypothetical protein
MLGYINVDIYIGLGMARRDEAVLDVLVVADLRYVYVAICMAGVVRAFLCRLTCMGRVSVWGGG